MTLRPESLIVAAAWLGTIPGLSASQVATTLPANTSSWAANGFVQLTVVSGTPNVDMPVYLPRIQIDTWAVSPTSGKPPWGKAAQLAQTIVDATYDPSLTGQLVTLSDAFTPARVLTVYAVSEPRRMYDPDFTSYARTTVDLQFAWCPEVSTA